MPKFDDFGRPIDPGVVALARAIRTVESKSNYKAKGASGEYGAYQWMPGNYEAASKKYFGEVLPKDPVNQDKVAYYQLLDLKNKGYTPEQVASSWNSGGPDYKGKVGVNKFGVKYDVPAYVSKVSSEYLKQREEDLALELPRGGGLQLGANIAQAAGPEEPGMRELDDVEKALGGTNEPVGFEKPFNLGEAMGEFSEGFVKEGLGFAKSLGNVGQFVLDQTAGRVVNAIEGKGFKSTGSDGSVSDIYRPGTKGSDDANAFLKPEGAAQEAGAFTAQVGEFLIPAGALRKAELGINLLIKGPGFLSAAGRVATKAGLEALAGGAVTLFSTGDPKKAAQGALLFGGTKGVLGSAGEIAKAYQFPERLYSMIFKNTYKDVLAQMDDQGLVAFQKNFPEEFQNLVKAGVIRTGKGGKLLVDETIAKQALDRGLKGNLKTMVNTVVADRYRTEFAVRKLAAASRTKVDLSEKQFRVILQQIAEDYGDVGFGEFAKKATAFDQAIKASKGKVSATTALEVRRFLDGLRYFGSKGGAQSPRLSLSQQNLKTLTDTLRGRLNKVPGMQKLMTDYAFNIEALEHLAKEAQRQGNRQLIGLIDAVFFSGAAVGDPAIGSALGLLRRALAVPSVATKGAQAIQQSGQITKTGAALKGAATSLLPSQGGQ